VDDRSEDAVRAVRAFAPDGAVGEVLVDVS
jgi:hypothetical protein